MIGKLKDNLASVAALIAAVAAIGGGFVKYGEISTRLSQIEDAQGETIDVSGIVANAEDIAVLQEKVENVEGKSVDLSGIESNLKKIGKNKDAIAEVEKKASVNEKTLQLFKLEIEEIKIKSKNPLGG